MKILPDKRILYLFIILLGTSVLSQVLFISGFKSLGTFHHYLKFISVFLIFDFASMEKSRSTITYLLVSVVLIFTGLLLYEALQWTVWKYVGIAGFIIGGIAMFIRMVLIECFPLNASNIAKLIWLFAIINTLLFKKMQWSFAAYMEPVAYIGLLVTVAVTKLYSFGRDVQYSNAKITD